MYLVLTCLTYNLFFIFFFKYTSNNDSTMTDFFPLPTTLLRATPSFIARMYVVIYLQLFDYIKQDCLDVTNIKKKVILSQSFQYF